MSGDQPAPAGGDVVYGLLTLAGMDVALPLSALREVVPRPPSLTGLPVRAEGLLGAMSLRTRVLPVVDLRPLIGLDPEQLTDQVVVVVAHGGQTLGLVADSVRGVSRIPADALLPMGVAQGRLLFSHTFRHLVTGTPVSVLDAAALLTLPGVPTVADARPQAVPGSDGAALRRAGTGRSLTLVRCGSHTLAFDVSVVHTTLPLTRVLPSVVSGDLCRGATHHAGAEVPVADPLALLGLPPLADAEIGAGLVLDFGHGLVVLAVSELLDLREVAPEDVLPVPRHAVRRPELVDGMADTGGGRPCLVVDGPALMRDAQLSALASVNTSLTAPPSPHGTVTPSAGAVAAGPPYLRFGAGVEVTTPLEQVAEILPFPHDVTATSADGAVLGVLLHRRAVVPVVCLATLLGRGPVEVTPSSCLLLVEVDGEHVAFAVSGLRGIDPLAWTDRDQQRGRPVTDLGRAVHTSPLVQVGTHSRLLPDLDLREVARALRGPAPLPTPEPDLVG